MTAPGTSRYLFNAALKLWGYERMIFSIQREQRRFAPLRAARGRSLHSLASRTPRKGTEKAYPNAKLGGTDATGSDSWLHRGADLARRPFVDIQLSRGGGRAANRWNTASNVRTGVCGQSGLLQRWSASDNGMEWHVTEPSSPPPDVLRIAITASHRSGGALAGASAMHRTVNPTIFMTSPTSTSPALRRRKMKAGLSKSLTLLASVALLSIFFVAAWWSVTPTANLHHNPSTTPIASPSGIEGDSALSMVHDLAAAAHQSRPHPVDDSAADN
eukprot:CAMPEP_0184725396 /NCGR_PEP_ID=MMETSP0314-20130426/30841_1 /TAXON_ID=38298 /ORGANISM="Rhodella maculata, Strain CCMP 736" /LENGTH=272 /DNA_ID=CAMNT_0027190617 /DNA_START=160 /DNA_END=975 /DNA_ORIENTATION=+